MVSMERHLGRFMASHEEAHRLMYLRPSMPMSMPKSAISSLREDSLTVRRPTMDLVHSQHELQQRIRCQALPTKRHDPVATSTAVSRRNARERKRVRLVNLGFSTLRERVPPGRKNKKLSKVETLRAAIDYIRQLQQVLGLPGQDGNENFAYLEDCSSVASSDDVLTGVQGGCVGPTGSGTELSPSSSHPSDCSLVSSPYAPQQTQDDQLIDIGVWFS